MKKTFLAILILVSLLITLWICLITFYSYSAEKSYKLKEYITAQKSWNKLLILSGNSKNVRFNLGVANYRLGNFSSAQNDFKIAALSREFNLQQQSLYNRGNTLVKLAELSTNKRGDVAESLYNDALKCYNHALLLNPQNIDIITNRSIANSALKHLQLNTKNHQSDVEKSEKKEVDVSQNSDSKKTPQSTLSTSKSLHGGQSTDNNQEGGTSSRQKMSTDQVERLLNEKRGGSILPSAIKAGTGSNSLIQPAKNW